MKEDEEPTLHSPDLHLLQTWGNVGAEGLRQHEMREELLGAAVHISVLDFQKFQDF